MKLKNLIKKFGGIKMKKINKIFGIIALLFFTGLISAQAGNIIVKNGQLNVSNNFIVDSSGNVGIGTMAPSAKLDIQSPNGIDPLRVYSADPHNPSRFIVKENGVVGIGTFSPNSALHVYESNDVRIILESHPLYSPDISQWRWTTTTSAVEFGTVSQNDLDFITNDLVQMEIDATGKVGIGTTNPTHKLNVIGDINATGSIYKNGGTAVDYVFDSYYGTKNEENKETSEGYNLVPLNELKGYVEKHRHLPRAESSKYTGQYEVGEMDAMLLEKIEEAHLYIIELKEENEQLKQRIDALESRR